MPLIGPLALLVIETAQQLENHVSIFDLGTGSLHPLGIQGERLTALQWFGDGCELYLNGDVYDLRGDIVWQVPSSVKAKIGNLNTARLSPEKGWLTYPVFSGSQTLDGSEFVDVEVISTASPFPSYRLTQHGGAEYESIVWSRDEKWVCYSDYDGNGVLQIFRATPDGQSREQLTNHEGGLGRVNSMALSPDGTQLAYGIVNLLATPSPYSYVETDEGWVGIIDLDTLSVTEVRLSKFGSAFSEGGLWWNQGSDELLVFGTSLPVSPTDPLRGKQLHWIRIDEDGVPFRSIYEAAILGNSIAWMMPLSDLESLFLRTQEGLFLFQEGAFSPYDAPELLNSAEANGRIIDFIPGWIEFPGKISCRDETVPAIPTHTTEAHIVQTPEQILTETLSVLPAATVTFTPAPNEVSDTNLHFVAEIPPAPDERSPQPSHVWWSKDGKMLFYQDVTSQQAWVYDLGSEMIRPITYQPRSEGEIAVQVAGILPPEATIISVSPSGQSILFGIPLADPIAPDGLDAEDAYAPRFTQELRLLRDGTVQPLGLVDSCFGYSAALWTLAEDQAIMNSGSVPDMPHDCMHDVWLIDTENLTVGSLPVPWQADEEFSVLDVSPDGKYLALRKDVNSVYEIATQREVSFSAVDIGRTSLIIEEDEIGLIFFEAAFTPSISNPNTVHDNIYSVNPTRTVPRLLGSVEGLVNQRVLSPDGKTLAFTTTNTFSGQKFENVQSGLWMLRLP